MDIKIDKEEFDNVISVLSYCTEMLKNVFSTELGDESEMDMFKESDSKCMKEYYNSMMNISKLIACDYYDLLIKNIEMISKVGMEYFLVDCTLEESFEKILSQNSIQNSQPSDSYQTNYSFFDLNLSSDSDNINNINQANQFGIDNSPFILNEIESDK